MKQSLILNLILASAMFISQNVTAAKVYQWTDAEGIVHFSDAPPADSAVTATREIHFDDFAENDSNQESYSIIDQANVMAAWRRQLTEDRLAVKRLQLEEQQLAQELELSRLQASNTAPSVRIPSFTPPLHELSRSRQKAYGLAWPLHFASLFWPSLHFFHSRPVLPSKIVPSLLSVSDPLVFFAAIGSVFFAGGLVSGLLGNGIWTASPG